MAKKEPVQTPTEENAVLARLGALSAVLQLLTDQYRTRQVEVQSRTDQLRSDRYRVEEGLSSVLRRLEGYDAAREALKERISGGGMSLPAIRDEIDAHLQARAADVAAADAGREEIWELDRQLGTLDDEFNDLTAVLERHDRVHRTAEALRTFVNEGLLEKDAAALLTSLGLELTTASVVEEVAADAEPFAAFAGRPIALLYPEASRRAITRQPDRIDHQVGLLRLGVDAASLLSVWANGGRAAADVFLHSRSIPRAGRLLAAVTTGLIELGVVADDEPLTLANIDRLDQRAEWTELDERVAQAWQHRQLMTAVIFDYRGFAPAALYSDSSFIKLAAKSVQQANLLQPDQPLGVGVDAADCLRAVLQTAQREPITETTLADTFTETFGGNRHAASRYATSVFGLLTANDWIDDGRFVASPPQLQALLAARTARLIVRGLIKKERLAQLVAESQALVTEEEPAEEAVVVQA